ncbi:MAG: redoxin domain-containing protein [Actinomycetota bacterium]|nr:redoxin domain-containing protein [Actinomycetota bacterium]
MAGAVDNEAMVTEATARVASHPEPKDGPLMTSGKRRPPKALLFAGAGAAVAALLALVLLPKPSPGGGTSPGGTSPGGAAAGGLVDGPMANLLQLDVFSHWFQPENFRLTDQYGKTVSLRQFRGKVVLLSFNDDQCPDLCTLLAQDVVAANRDMGPRAKQVVFLGVNVNPFYPGVRYVKSWTDNHGLGQEANWIFTTGPVKRLEAVWKRYGVTVALDRKARTVQHSADLYFINPAGHAVALGEFGNNDADTALFAHAMAQAAVDLLPRSQRGPVGGPSVPAPTPTNATVGAPAPSFDLPLLNDPRRALSSSALRGRYVVINFWASTCTACKQEMPHIEQAYREVRRDLGNQVAFVGVDVSDRRLAAAAFAKRAGVTYSLASDASGALAGAYRIPGLPFTAVVGPHGKVLIRHPGALSTEQLKYVVESEAALGGATGLASSG